jgi:hypothetical protein
MGFVSDHQVADSNVVPAGRQTWGSLVAIRLVGFGWRRLTGKLQLFDELVIKT